MEPGRGARGSPGGRPPPKRTYGSKQGSRRGFRQTDGQHPAVGGENSAAELSKHIATTTAPLPESADGRTNAFKADGTKGLLLQQSAGRYGGAVGGGLRSAEEISQLVHAAGQGGEGGRTAAIALAQACKSRETRKTMRANAAGILSELTSALSMSLETEGGDEALVHGLAVTMFILSKDRALVKAFSAPAVSTLAVLIEGRVRHDSVIRDSLGTRSGAAAASSAAATAVRRGKAASFVGTLGTIKEKNSSGSTRRTSALQGESKPRSPFDISDEDEGDGLVGGGGGCGPSNALVGDARRTLLSNGLGSSNTTNRGALPQARNHHGSTTVTVRARMLLDIADMVPWGMSNRHLVSAADLGLATLLNVAAQACPESGEKVGGAAGGSAAGDSVDEEFSTQGSMGSQSEPNSVGGGSATGQADGSDATTAHNAGVMPELSRLAPTGFLLPVIVGGASVLGDLSSGTSRGGGDAGGARASDAAVDPSSLRSAHQLFLALRLLDLATLESSNHGDVAATKAREDANSAPDSPWHHTAELTGALLDVIAKCQPLCGDGRLAPTEGHEKLKVPAPGKGGAERKQRAMRSPQPVVGKEVAARVHECLLAALRVLINVTHHDARVCEEVASRGGLDTLMSCLVARSFCGTHGSDGADSNGGNSRSDLALLEEVVNGPGEGLGGAGLEQGGGDSRGEASTGEGDFDAQILAMSALINCVELKESADNCAAMASLAVRPPATARATDQRMFGGHRQKQKELLLGVVGDLSSSRCLAPEFLARLLIRCTRSFAHQLEAGRSGEDDEEGPASPAPARMQQPGHGTTDHHDPRDGAGASTGLSVAPTEAPATSPAPVMPQGGDSGEQLMSHAEGTDLVLGGHCALLLGLLIREQEANRRLALPVLPDGDPTLIVRVLEAFMALQFQAGVLTEEMVLAVQGLVEELEGLEALPLEEWDPLELHASDEATTAAEADTTTTASRQRSRKRPRSPTSEQRAGEAGGDSDNADNFTLSVKRPRTDNGVDSPRGEQALPSWMSQLPCRQATSLAKASKPKGSASVSASASASSSSASTQATSEELPATTTPSKNPGGSNACETPPSRKHTPGSAKGSPSWPVGGSSIAGRIGMGLRGRSAAGTRNWLGGSSRLRTYGSRGSYGSPAWKSQPSRPLAGVHARHTSREAAGDQGAASSNAVFEILSDDSEDETGANPPRLSGGGGNGGGSSSIKGSGVGPRSGRDSTAARPATGSAFDINDWSGASNERPAKTISKKGTDARSARVPTCQLQSLASKRGGTGGSGGNDEGVEPAPSRLDKQPRRPPGPTPSPPPAAARARSRSPSPPRGVGPRSGWSSRGSSATQATLAATTAAAAIATGARNTIGQRPGHDIGDVASRPPIGRSSKSKEAYERRVGVRPERSSSPVAIDRQQGKGAGAGAGALRAPVGSGGDVKARVGALKEPATRRVLGAKGSVREGSKELAEKTASRSVFDMDDVDDSD